ncbi:MAG: YceD family protein [Methylotenera sp.]|nr:YceD family protein [Methylotenera sp.]
MSKHPILIDNLAFSKKNEYLKGELPLEDCPRLYELLKPSNVDSVQNLSALGSIGYVLQGKTDAVGQHLLHLSLTTNITTICQRCLSKMPLKLNLSFSYLIGNVSDTDAEAVDIDNSDDFDLQQASKSMDVVALIEDEIIMAMPIAPKHAEGCIELVTQSGENPNPFAALKGLIKP